MSTATERIERLGRRAAESAYEQAQRYGLDQPGELFSDFSGQVQGYVREHPVQLTLIGIGLGCLIAALFVRQ